MSFAIGDISVIFPLHSNTQWVCFFPEPRFCLAPLQHGKGYWIPEDKTFGHGLNIPRTRHASEIIKTLVRRPSHLKIRHFYYTVGPRYSQSVYISLHLFEVNENVPKLVFCGLSIAYSWFLVAFDTKSSFKYRFLGHTVHSNYKPFQCLQRIIARIYLIDL